MQPYDYSNSNFIKLVKVFLVYAISFFCLISFGYATAPLPSPNYASLVIDSETGTILHHHESKAKRYPASLTKMMTLYILFDKLQSKAMDMNTKIYISAEANRMEPSNLPVVPGTYITVKEAIYALIVKSANNVSYALANKLGNGNVDNFIDMMNQTAAELELHHTKFANPHGLPNQEQFTTAYDMARLGMALQRHHPKYYKMFATDSFKFRGKIIRGHNKILKKYRGTDGIKTGYIGASGFNIVTSVNKPKGKMIAVVMGGRTAAERDLHVIRIIDAGYQKLLSLKNHKSIYEAGEVSRAEAHKIPVGMLRKQITKIKRQTQSNKLVRISKEKIKTIVSKKRLPTKNLKKQSIDFGKNQLIGINSNNKQQIRVNSVFNIPE